MTDNNISEFMNNVVAKILTGHTTEHSFRPTYQDLFKNLPDIIAINEPKRSENGAPDFVFLDSKNQDKILGYAEMKDVDKNLDDIEKSEQMDRYKGYKNIFLTNNLDWRFFRNGEKYFEIKIGEYDTKSKTVTKIYSNHFAQLSHELQAFFDQTPESITNGRRLAEIMGGKARRIRENIAQIFADSRDSEIKKIYEMMKELLVADLTEEQFADMYSQTLVYGLFVARYNDNTQDNFSRAEARDLVPATNPFLREFFDHITGSNFNKSLSYIVDELCEVFEVSDIKSIVHKHLKITDDSNIDTKDPIIHFYEDFLASYDAKLRKQMGAYYTPIPVVRYIIRSVDRILKDEFKIIDGIADNEKIKYTQSTDPYQVGKSKVAKTYYEKTIEIPRVQILDPAVGTATFLNETIKYIHSERFSGQQGLWESYANENILPRLNGFELMMTPYTIAHLKLGMTLNELGATRLKDRLRVFLTNTLTEGIEKDLPLFTLIGLTKIVAEESNLAAEVKNDRPMMVIIGNPPYSGESSNKTTYANNLVNKYKVEPGGKTKLQERNPKWINDDYVKFIAFSEEMIEKNSKGIIAMITNNGYLDNPTFRGMRWHLTQTFDKIYCLDLHGNAKKKEVAPDGSKDENVFDIMQGVSIILALKTTDSKSPARVYYSEIYGKRSHKFNELDKDAPSFKELKLDQKMYYFVNKNNEGKEEYDRGIALNELMPINSVGIVTGKDEVLINENPDTLIENVADFKANGTGKIFERLQKTEIDKEFIEPIAYRPFDKRYIYFDTNVVERSRDKVMKNFLTDAPSRERGNLAMIFKRGLNEENSSPIFIVDCISESRSWSRPGMQGVEFSAPLYVYNYDKNTSIAAARQQKTDGFNHIFTSDKMIESSFVSNKTAEITSQFPLYLTQNVDGRRANFDDAKLKELFSDVEQPNDNSRKVYPEDILDYTYATLHNPIYRQKYKEFLKADFPRVPRAKSWVTFWKLVELGRELRNLHLMKTNVGNHTTYPETGDNLVDKIEFVDNKIYINSRQYFGDVSKIAWNFFIGGYQPVQKWLKDRKGRKLSSDDIIHFQKIIAILCETDRIMKEIASLDI
jgi:predicted helicase